ncbi:EpsG family protein [Sporolactobacillus terrae]|uniref:EpsG family protein n=1 Tax=Sporolactobacillus terrae TaxID=269673 RepID=A0ABX5Q4L6_9BACL|nr:EpsG family protein [Sporolactobacillus terrae]QAA21578.1 hypothetical protein C0674_02465 [Sporolactobacillus terrae]QAA24550.1 hypothetical protein C0679_02445 [Sporolactobacillus terrae]
MFVYTFASAVSVIFAYLSQHVRMPSSNLSELPNYGGVKSQISKKQSRINNNISAELFFVLLSFLPLFLVSAVRYLVGTDYAGTYQYIYNYVYTDGYHFNLTGETLYALLNRIAIFYSGSDYVGVFALSSLLICGLTFIGLRNQSLNFSYSVLLWIISGFYFWSFNVVRQAIIMAIFVFAFQYIQKREAWKYFTCIIIAAGFHTMALLYLPVYFMYRLRINFKVMLIILFVFAGFSSIIRQLAYIITSKIPIFNVYAIRYFESSRFDANTESSISHLFINLAFFILFAIIVSIHDRKRKLSNIWINIQFIALAFTMLSQVLPLANRISRLFEIVLILSIPSITRLIPNKNLRLCVNVGIIFSFILYSFITFYVLRYHDVFPYQTIFSR